MDLMTITTATMMRLLMIHTLIHFCIQYCRATLYCLFTLVSSNIIYAHNIMWNGNGNTIQNESKYSMIDPFYKFFNRISQPANLGRYWFREKIWINSGLTHFGAFLLRTISLLNRSVSQPIYVHWGVFGQWFFSSTVRAMQIIAYFFIHIYVSPSRLYFSPATAL